MTDNSWRWIALQALRSQFNWLPSPSPSSSLLSLYHMTYDMWPVTYDMTFNEIHRCSMTYDGIWQMSVYGKWQYMTGYNIWQYDIWLYLTYDRIWHMTGYDTWQDMTYESIWHMTLCDITWQDMSLGDITQVQYGRVSPDDSLCPASLRYPGHWEGKEK